MKSLPDSLPYVLFGLGAFLLATDKFLLGIMMFSIGSGLLWQKNNPKQ